ncbi:two-component regulator propeller domain-containing protein [Myroides sp. LJL115]
MSNNSVHRLLAHSNGDIWIATWDGINIYDGNKLIIHKNDPFDSKSLAGNSIICLIEDAKQDVWLLSDSKQLSRYNPKTGFQNIDLPFFGVALFLDDKYGLVIQSDKHQFYYLNDNQELELLSQFEFPLLMDSEVQDSIRHFWKNHFVDQNINKIIAYKEGQFLVGTNKNGLYLVQVNDKSQVEILENFTSDVSKGAILPSNEIVDIIKDKYQVVWLGFKDGGIAKMYSQNNGIGLVSETKDILPQQTVRAILKDQQQNLWLGYYNKGVYIQKSKQQDFKYFDLKQDNEDWLRVRSLFQDSNNSVWVGTYAGVIRIEDQSKVMYYSTSTDASMMSNRTYAIAQDKNQNIWMGGWGGLSKFDLKANSFVPFAQQASFKQYNIRKIVPIGDKLYIATEHHGIILYDLKTQDILGFDQKKGLVGNSVYDIYYDPVMQQFWIASLGGITIVDNQLRLITTLTESDGLPSHLVYSLNAVSGKIWISTTKGIATIDMKNRAVVNYSNLFLWQGLEFSEGAYFFDSDEQLFYGGTKGINTVDTKEFFHQSSVPDFKLWVDEQVVTQNEVVQREYSNSSLQLELYPIGIHSHGINQFEYRIAGLFQEYRPLLRNIIYLDNLDSGKYVLQVRDKASVDSGPLFSKEITILPPFYQRIYFIVIVFISIAFVIYGGYFLKKYWVKRQQKQLQQKVKKHTHKISLEKENLARQNRKLRKFNQHIYHREQQLLSVHSSLRNKDIDLENFRAYLFFNIQRPIAELLEGIEQNVSKNKLRDLAIIAYQRTKDWEPLKTITDFGENSPIYVNVKDFVGQTLQSYITKDKTSKQVVFFNNQLPDDLWAEIDIARFQSLIHHLLHECSKFCDKKTGVTLGCFTEQGDVLVLEFQSKCELLKKYWKFNKEFSPYTKAINRLSQDLGVCIQEVESNDFQLNIQLALSKQQTEVKQPKWSQEALMQQISPLPANKVNLLVLVKEQDQSIVENVLATSTNCHVVFAKTALQGVDYLNLYSFQGIIIYDSSLDKNLHYFLEKCKENRKNSNATTFYLCQQSTYFLQDKLYALGVNQIIHLPISAQTWNNKILEPLSQIKQSNQLKDILQVPLQQIAQEEVQISFEQKLLRKALGILQQSYSRPEFSIEELTQELGVSKIKCYRLFKDNLDKSPMELLVELRMERAKSLIHSNTGMTISEISFECGYNDPKYFSKTFKKIFGITPSAYCKEKS